MVAVDVGNLAASLGHVPADPTWPTDQSREPVPMSLFGRDHWSTFAYVETRIVDHRGLLDHDHMRCHAGRHPVMLGAKRLVVGASADGSRHPTRIKASATPRADGTFPATDLRDHDDYDCLDDLVAAGLLQPFMPRVGPLGHYVDVYGRMIGEGIRPDFVTGLGEKVLATRAQWTLTELGRRVAAELREYKAGGGRWDHFIPSPEEG